VSSAPAPESWEQWASRVAAELADLADGEWLTVTAAPAGASGSPGSPHASAPYAAESADRARRWSLRRGSPPPASATRDAMADVFIQARRLEGVLALECISDTEFEGLSDLSAEQEQALLALGWRQDGHEPALHRTYAHASPGVGGSDETGNPDVGTEAARLMRDSLEKVLGAPSPESVVLRRSAGREH
jgi:hypothetical protein